MSATQYRLSIEELAYAMGVLGGTDTATGFLLAILGERPRMETEGRLLAASHALVARGYLDFDIETGEKWLDDGLSEVVSPILANDFSLRCSKATEEGEEVRTLYAADEMVISHKLQHSVVSIIESAQGWQMPREQLTTFFELDSAVANGAVKAPIATIPVNLLTQMQRQSLIGAPEQAKTELQEHGVPEPMAEAIIQDMKTSSYRGSVIKLRLENEQDISDEGFLLLKGQERVWLFVIDADDASRMTLWPGTIDTFRQHLQLLIT